MCTKGETLKQLEYEAFFQFHQSVAVFQLCAYCSLLRNCVSAFWVWHLGIDENTKIISTHIMIFPSKSICDSSNVTERLMEKCIILVIMKG
jgi:hypothetical protein